MDKFNALTTVDEMFMDMAAELAEVNVSEGGGPFSDSA